MNSFDLFIYLFFANLRYEYVCGVFSLYENVCIYMLL